MGFNTDLLLFPASLPDETLASRASRYHILARNPKTRDSFQQLFGKPRAALTDMVPPDVPSLAMRLPGDSRTNLNELLSENTLFPLVTLLGSWSPPGDWLSATAKPATIRRRTLGLAGMTRLCEHCVREDFNTHGSAYLHRAHQVPGVTCCWRHRIPLIERCPDCLCPFEQTRELFEMPWKPCGCGYRFGSDVSSPDASANAADAAHGYAMFVRNLLLKVPGTYPVSAIASACRKKLLELGLSWGPRKVGRTAAAAALEDYYGIDVLNQMDPAYAAGKRDQWFRMGSTSGAPDVPLSRYLLAAHFLFSDVERFTQALDVAAREVNESALLRDATPKPAVAQKAEDKVSRTVNELRRVLEENPRYTLEDLWVRYRGTLTRLLKWDSKAFAQVRALAQKSRPLRLVPSEKVSPDPRDAECADRLRQAALRLYAGTDRPVKISRQMVGRAANLMRVVSARPAYPLSNEVLDGFAETQWHFYARRYLWTRAQLTGETSPSELWRHAGIWYYKFVELDGFFRAHSIALSSRLREGQIVAMLSEHGIDFKWEGPCPEKTFARSGRAYVKKGTSSARAIRETEQKAAAGKADALDVEVGPVQRKRA